MTPELRTLRARVAALEKLFSDAGQGNYNVLALIDHYQSEAMAASERRREAEARVKELEEARRADITLMCNAYDAGFDRAAKDGMAGFHPDHVKRCKADGRKMAEAVLALADAEKGGPDEG